MTARRWLALALAGPALALAACGGDDTVDPGNTTTSVTNAPPTVTVPNPDLCAQQPEGPLPVELTWQADPALQEGATTIWTIRVRNTAITPIGIPFATAQQADVVLRLAGTEYYRWSKDRTFAQVASCKTLPVGASYTIRLPEERPFTVLPGTYNLEIVLTVDGEPISQTDFVAVAPPPRQP